MPNQNNGNNTGHVMQRSRYSPVPDSSFSIERISIQKPSYSDLYHFHSYYELYYLYSGERYYFIKDKTYHVQSGTLVLIKPYDIHHTTNCAEHGYDRHLIYFEKSYLKDLAEAIGKETNLLECFDKDISIIKLNMHERHFVETLLKTMEKEYIAQEKDHEIYLKTSLIQLLIFMNRHSDRLSENDITYINASHKTISEITAYMNTNYREDISLQSISKKFFISPYHLSRTFKKITGFSFIEYLNGIRIKEAQTLLRKDDMHISEIAEKVGYNSTTHFGRIFKSITGTSPLLYKKLHQKK